MSFIDTIIFQARMVPERPAIVLRDQAVTYHMLVQGMVAVENRLALSPLKRGDVAAILIDNPIRHFTVMFALYRLGIASVSISRPEQIGEGGVKSAAVLADRPLPGALLVDDSWFPARPTDTDIPARPPFAADQICRIRYSTGTTGGRKAIGFTPANVEWGISVRITMNADIGWHRLLCLQNYHYAGFGNSLMPLVTGNMLLFAEAPDEALRLIDLYKVDLVAASPAQLRQMVAAQRQMPTSLPSLKLISIGGGIVDDDLRAAAQAQLCKNIRSIYAATESGPMAVGTVERMRDFPNAAGFVAPWAKVEIVDEDDRILPPGEEGTLRVRTEGQARALTAAAAKGVDSADGWFMPGDRGKLLPNGVLIITGRISEMIEIAGTPVAPERIEELLLRRSDVSDAAAVGITDAAGATLLCIAVVPNGPGLDGREIAAYLIARNPALIAHQVKIVDRIPRGETGKIQRRVLREQFQGPS